MPNRQTRILGLMSILVSFAPCVEALPAADFVAPTEIWRARVPGPSCPHTCQYGIGDFAEFGDGLLALRRYAASRRPDRSEKPYSPRLAQIPFLHGEYDSDDDGRDDRFGFTHEFADVFTARRGCTAYLQEGIERGWYGVLNGGSVLLYDKMPSGALSAIEREAYVGGATNCAGQPPGIEIRRGQLPVFELRRERGKACPAGTTPTDLVHEDAGCSDTGGIIPERNLGAQCPAISNGSNPINAVTGNKYQREVDYAGTSRGHLRFERHYNSQSMVQGSLGPRWSHTYERYLVRNCVSNSQTRVCSIRAYRADGRVTTFVKRNSAWQADATVSDMLTDLGGDRFELRNVDGTRERYQPAGVATTARTAFQLLEIIDAAGIGESLEYDGNGRLARIVAPGARALGLSYDARGRLVNLTDPAGASYAYTHDALDNLRSVTYPAAASDHGIAPQRQYVYEDPRDVSALTGIIDELGQRFATWSYDAAGRAVSSEHAGGADRVAFDYQPSYTTVTDTRNQTRSFNTTIEAGVGLITAVSGPHCATCGPEYRAATRYDTRGFKQIVTDAAGTITRYTHDDSGREIERVEALATADARTTTRAYDAVSGLPSSIELKDATDIPVWRATNTYWQGRLKQHEEFDLLDNSNTAGTRRTIYTYFGEDPEHDPAALFGLVKHIDGPRTDADDSTHFEYDPVTLDLVQMTNALGQVWRYESHDAHGRARVVVDPNGMKVTTEYHPRGWLRSRQVDEALTGFTYDAAGQLLRVDSPDGASIVYSYDAAHRLTAVADAEGNVIAFTLDAQGNRIREEVRDANGLVSRQFEREYDLYNQLVVARAGEGQTTHYGYDANGREITVTGFSASSGGGEARTDTFGYDAIGRQNRRVDALGSTLVLNHGVRNELTSFTDAIGVVTHQHYNGYGELVVRESPDRGRMSYGYDAAGNRTSETDAESQTTHYTYDALNRLTLTTYPDGSTARQVYDEPAGGRYATGRLTTRADTSGTTRYQYDSHGNVTRKELDVAGQRFLTSYVYSATDQLAAVTYPSGRRVTYVRDLHGRIERMTSAVPGRAEAVVVDEVRYQPFGPLRAFRYGNGLRMSRVYDRDYRISEMRHDEIYTRVYRYDGFDNLISTEWLDDSALDEHYEYDARSRLTMARGPWGELRWSYDANGNRLAARAGVVTENYSYESGTNRLDAIRDPAGALRSDYVTGANGRVIGMAGYSFSYGAGGRLARVRNLPGTFDYRLTHYATGNLAQDRSVQVSAQARIDSRRRYHEDERGRIIEVGVRTTSTTSTGTQETRGLEEILYLDELPIAWSFNRETLFLHSDHLGTPVAASDADGRVRRKESMQPFMGAAPPGLHQVTAIGYPGQRLLRQVPPIVHNGWREYDGRSGRYLQPDPLGVAGGDNPYIYAENNPVRWIDPTGLAIWLCSRAANNMPGNHAYLWDDRGGGRSCGKARSSGHAPGRGYEPTGANESGPPTDACARISESEGWEDAIMGCCTRNANNGTWLPFVNDCQNAARQCLEGIVIDPPPIPGGRFGMDCSGGC